MQPQIAKRILKKKHEVEGLTLPDFKTYFTAMTVKANLHSPGNGTAGPGRDPLVCAGLLSGKDTEAIRWNEGSLSTNGSGETGHPHAEG